MIRRSLALLSALTCVTLASASRVAAQESRPTGEFLDESERYSREQLDNLVGAIALYPDALLAQVLVAATFPDQVEDAARYVRQNGTTGIDDQPWDVSVKSVAHYPSALNMMAEKADWTAALGRAYALQSSEVMAAVQRLRAMADAQGNLRTTPQQVVTREQADYVIAPAQPRVIYVPVYDPYVVYTRPIFVTSAAYTPFWSFGIGFPIGGWLTYDVNWRSRAVYYNGWDALQYGYGGGWRARSRPYIQITNIYVNPRYRSVFVNRDVVRRRVQYGNVDRYGGVHREIGFSRDFGSARDRVERQRRDVRNDFRDDNRYDSRNDNRYGGGSSRYDSRSGSRPDSRYDGRDDAGSSRRGNIGGRGDVPAGGMDRSRSGWQTPGETSPGGWTVDRTRGSDANREQRDQGRGAMNPGRDANRPAGMAEEGMRRDGGRTRERDVATPQAREPFSRRDMPMVNPRRAEPAESRPATPGQGGRQQQGGERTARERPVY